MPRPSHHPHPDLSKSTPNESANGAGPIKLCVVATVAMTIQQLSRGRLEYLADHGFEITVVIAPTPEADRIRARGVKLFFAPLVRAISPWHDLRALWRLWRFFRRERFDLVEVSTPKAALIGSLAARLAARLADRRVGVPRLVHILRGLAYQAGGGIGSRLLKFCHAVPCALADTTIAVSPSLLDQAHRDGVCDRRRAVVFHQGSSNGVDGQKFSPATPTRRAQVRREYGLPLRGLVIGFVGRMTIDKGVVELVDVFERLPQAGREVYLLLVGPYEHRDKPPQRIVSAIDKNPRIVHLGWQQDTASCYAAMDVFALPSHREGCPNAVLEAGSCGVATVATDILGCRDLIEHGHTGLLVPVSDTQALGDALLSLMDDAHLRAKLGQAGRSRMQEHFEQGRIWRSYETCYKQLLHETANRPAGPTGQATDRG